MRNQRNKIHNVYEKNDEMQFLPSFSRFSSLLLLFKDQWKTLTLFVIFLVLEHIFIVINGATGHWSIYLLYSIINIFFFSLNSFFLFPLFIHGRSAYVALIPLAFSVLVQVLCYMLVFAIYYPPHLEILVKAGWVDWVNNLWPVLQKLIFCALLWLVNVLASLLLERTNLLENYLHSKLNPHLMFNCLHHIHTSMEESNDPSTRMIILLSELSKRSLASLDIEGRTEIQNELEMVNILIELHSIRTEKHVYMVINQSNMDKDESVKVPPQIVLSIVDNALKYGVSDQPDRPIKLNIGIFHKEMRIEINNAKPIIKPSMPSLGIGLENLRLRIKNLYGTKGRFQIVENVEEFCLKINIPI